MPLYEFECVKCGCVEEYLLPHHDSKKVSCPSCPGRMKRVMSSSSAHFKGTGFYATDKKRDEPKIKRAMEKAGYEYDG